MSLHDFSSFLPPVFLPFQSEKIVLRLSLSLITVLIDQIR